MHLLGLGLDLAALVLDLLLLNELFQILLGTEFNKSASSGLLSLLAAHHANGLDHTILGEEFLKFLERPITAQTTLDEDSG